MAIARSSRDIKFHYARGRKAALPVEHTCMKTPADCASLGDVRAEIDRIDRTVIALLGERAGYVHAAARFKATEAEVAAPERQAAMLRDRRAWAEAADLDPDVVEKLYR